MKTVIKIGGSKLCILFLYTDSLKNCYFFRYLFLKYDLCSVAK